MQSVVALPVRTDNADPRRVNLEDAVERVAEELSPAAKLSRLAAKQGNFADAMSAIDLVELGAKVVDEYERDKEDRKEWADIAEEALSAASQGKACEEKTYPWKGASNVRFPLLTSAALQFNARMYPAVVKGDEAVLCKVIGQDNGQPELGPDGQPLALAPDGKPMTATEAAALPPEMMAQLAPKWKVRPGAKTKRAQRVSEYLNTVLFYRMEDWEEDTDALLMQLPIVGCVFRKVWFSAEKGVQSAMVPALRLLVPDGARSLATSPRVTEEIPDVYPHQIKQAQREGRYLDVDLGMPSKAENDDGPRLLLEQHRLIDLDEDGLDEPYIVTVDHETRQVLRIEANFGPQDVEMDDSGRVIRIHAGQFYIKYGMFPHPEGKFYDIGLGHLLKHLSGVIDTAINQLMDAGNAQTAGGGFIGSGVRLQTRGNRGRIVLQPGEYKTVDVSGDNLRSNIVERTLPNVSPVTFQVLDLIMGAARDISGAKDVITGEASNTGQVGTTLALIEQGLQVFNATAKRIFRSLKDEYTLLAFNIGKYGGEKAKLDYANVLDDPEADFEADFSADDMDIRPVSDPSSVTRMQKMAKSQYIMGTIPMLATVGGDPREALKRAYEAADVEDIEKLIPPPKPQPQDPAAEAAKQAQVELLINNARKSGAEADKTMAEAAETVLDAQKKKHDLGMQAMHEGMGAATLDH